MIDFDFISSTSLLDDPPDSSVIIPEPGTPGPLFFDLETVPDTSRQHLFGLEPIPEPIPETLYDDMMSPEEFLSQTLKAINESIVGRSPEDRWINEVRNAEKKAKKPRDGVFKLLDSLQSSAAGIDVMKADQCKTMSVTPEFCQIVAIGFAAGDQEPQSILCRDLEEEKAGLATLWDAIANVRGPVCGYNIGIFDLPAIMVRSVILGVTPRKYFGDLKPWDRDKAIDLMTARFPRSKAMKLKDLARYYGLGLDVDAEGVDGSQVSELFQRDPAKLLDYVKSDVTLARRLYKLWKGTFV